MAMTREEIVAERERLDERDAELWRERELLLLDRKRLWLRCPHPDSYPYSVMGESGTKCPDCGWST